MTLDNLIDELDDARAVARETGKASAMISATLAKAKLLGLDKGIKEGEEAHPVKVVIQVEDARLRDEQGELLPRPS